MAHEAGYSTLSAASITYTENVTSDEDLITSTISTSVHMAVVFIAIGK